MGINNEDIEQHIRMAYKMVRRLDITEPELQREAFIYALQTASPTSGLSGATAQATQVHDSAYTAIAKALELPPEQIELFYDIRDGELHLNLPTRALPDSRSAAMREIGILLAVGRKHAGLGISTPLEVIRAACDEHGKLDKRNFAVAMTGMKPRLTTSGKGSERELIPKRPADDLAREIIERYQKFS